jgi:hypothetical protein
VVVRDPQYLTLLHVHIISTGNHHHRFSTSVQCRLSRMRMKKKPSRLYFYLGQVKRQIITYPWGEHSFKWEWPFFFFFNWAIAMATGNSFNREWDRREGKEKKGYQSIYNMYMVTINGLFYMSIEEIWIYAYLKLNIIYRDRNNGGSQNRCRVKEKRVNCMLS